MEVTDRELLELAAKAAGIEIYDWFSESVPIVRSGDDGIIWLPLKNDGDALRLAVKLEIHLTNSKTDAWATTETVTAIEPMTSNPCAATRRAIVRAAAAIGQSFPAVVGGGSD